MVKRTRVLDVPVRVERAEGRMRIMEAGTPTNAQIASELEAIADLLDLTETNTFRVRAYRQGAQQVKQAGEPLADLVMRGAMERLTDLPGIGRGLAGVIAEYVMTGRTGLHQELLSEVSPEDAFRRIPGIGGGLARRAAETLGISTLEELERAAHDGRLARVEGFGKRRVEMVRAALAGMLGGSALKRSRTVASEAPSVAQRPPVDLLLEVDREYRRKAEEGRLRTIAPRRFNPEGKPWLPVMRMFKEGWNFTALYSNTPRAHELGKTRDWVVIYYDRDGDEGRATVVTARLGKLGEQRVVRGRERESLEYYISRVA